MGIFIISLLFIIKTLKNKELLDFIVDADQFYTDKHTHEAGQFIREIQDELFDNQQLNFIDNYFNPKDPSEKKHIKIISVAQPILQTKILPQILKPLKDSTIIVPNDETLLPALLQSYDWTKAKANITMSYNIKKTLICQLFDTIFTIVENQELLSEHHICYATDINAFFDNGIINSILTKRHQEKSTTKIFYNKEDFHEIFTTDNTLATLCGQLFFDENDNVQFLTKLKTFVALLNNNPNINFDDIDKEILQQLDLYFDKLLSLISTKDDNLVADKASLKFLFNSFITNIALSFQSDADNNLQLMGMLESRTLDFDNVILLSVNENILPNNSRNKTFIPFDLRKHFGMQTFDSKDAVSAYHFYRLLQRAKNIFLIYSLENGNRESAEKSRFIMQIEQELCDYCTIDNESFNLDFVKTTQNQAIKIPKNQNIIKTLSKCSFSASNLNDYLQCNLKFYFSNILKINEIKNKQYISDDTFGTVIHRYFEEFDWADFKLPSQDDIKNRVLNLYKDQKYALHDLEIANNYIIVQVTIKYIYDYLKFYNQHRQTIDNVIDKEKKIELSIDLQNTKQIKLKGILDRIDEQNGQIIINDYKTGSIKPSDCSIKDLDIETLSKKPKTFQLLFYTYLYRQSKQCSNLQARIISLRNINIEIPLTIKGQTNIDQNIFNEFQKILEAIFMDMFDITKDFAMTDDEKKCIYCPYATICGRETTNGF